MSKKSDSSYDNSSMGQSTADEFEGMLKEATKAARQRRKHRRTSRSSTLFHSDSENSVELPSGGVLCRELHLEDELNDSGLGNSTLNAASFSPAILTKGIDLITNGTSVVGGLK
jgi:hypothetical protein